MHFPSSDRRKFPRQPRLLQFRYIDSEGVLPAVSADVSPGGAFLMLRHLPPRDSTVRLSFTPTPGATRVVQLAARVERVVDRVTEREPRVGVGVRWLKAGSQGDPAVLMDFLGRLGIDARQGLEKQRAPSGADVFVYSFEDDVREPPTAPVQADRDERPTAISPVPSDDISASTARLFGLRLVWRTRELVGWITRLTDATATAVTYDAPPDLYERAQLYLYGSQAPGGVVELECRVAKVAVRNKTERGPCTQLSLNLTSQNSANVLATYRRVVAQVRQAA